MNAHQTQSIQTLPSNQEESLELRASAELRDGSSHMQEAPYCSRREKLLMGKAIDVLSDNMMMATTGQALSGCAPEVFRSFQG